MAGQSKPPVPDGPIPGENFTSDTKNYPWHRPPEHDDLDNAIEDAVSVLTEKKKATALLTMLQSGVSVVQATDIFVTSGIGKGKWTPDYALMLAGPVAKTIQLMADAYGIKYQMGLDDDPDSTIEFIKEVAKLDPQRVEQAGNEVKAQSPDIVAEAGKQNKGFSAGPPTEAPIPAEQGMM